MTIGALPDRQLMAGLLLGCACLIFALLSAWPATFDLGHNWIFNEAYSHGFVLVAAAAFLAWRNAATGDATRPSWLFLPAGLGSLFIILIAHLSELHVVAHYGYFGLLVSLVLAVSGFGGLRKQFIPLCLVLLAIPIPGYLQYALTSDLKLISSQLGGQLLHLLRVPVYIQGNIIDLGTYRLHVADACSGLNYLVPLLAIGVLLAGFLQTTVWRRLLLVFMTIPLTIAMNVVRIAIAGLMVRHIGPETAEGFIHDFEGWMVFVATLALLLPLTALLLRLGPQPTTLKRAFIVDLSVPRPQALISSAAIRNLIVLLVLTVGMSLAALGLKSRDANVPQRTGFETFPLLIGKYIGSAGILDDASLDILKLTDYALVRYQSGTDNDSLDLLATWYAEQTDGATPHSPEICLPGAGWEIAELERRRVILGNGIEIPLNRAVLERRGEKMLAYYWFQQRGRLFANEFAMKWFIVQDAVLENRVDGGMVRLTTTLDGPAEEADQRLQAFMTEIWPVLPRYLPD